MSAIAAAFVPRTARPAEIPCEEFEIPDADAMSYCQAGYGCCDTADGGFLISVAPNGQAKYDSLGSLVWFHDMPSPPPCRLAM